MVRLPVLDCGGCGLCCHGQAFPPFMETELDALPGHLVKGLPTFEEPLGRKEGPCVWLTGEGRCGHYEHRPEACRQFEMGGEDCLEVRRAAGR